MESKYPDNDGFDPKGLPIIEDGEYSLRCTADAKGLYELLAEQNIPTSLSDDADSFICNCQAYKTSSMVHANGLATKNLFIHVPLTTDYQDKIELPPGKIYMNPGLLYKGIQLLIQNI